ncbi:MAG: arsenate reductase family protein [Clostridia bacterium]|nr:arsenate reductase family protein [Clostridia bacterium]
MQFLCHPGCSTCKKAREFLEQNGISFVLRDIRTENPTAVELAQWHRMSGLPLRRFFNTSGQLYRELALKDKLPALSEEQQLALLAQDGMLVRRPILAAEEFVLIGFRENEWKSALNL